MICDKWIIKCLSQGPTVPNIHNIYVSCQAFSAALLKVTPIKELHWCTTDHTETVPGCLTSGVGSVCSIERTLHAPWSTGELTLWLKVFLPPAWGLNSDLEAESARVMASDLKVKVTAFWLTAMVLSESILYRNLVFLGFRTLLWRKNQANGFIKQTGKLPNEYW